MGNGDVFNGDAPVFAEVPKMMASKRGSEVSDDTVREAKTMDNVFKELDYFLCGSRDKRFVLCIAKQVTGNHLSSSYISQVTRAHPTSHR